jgi:hypothetical protein
MRRFPARCAGRYGYEWDEDDVVYDRGTQVVASVMEVSCEGWCLSEYGTTGHTTRVRMFDSRDEARAKAEAEFPIARGGR